MNSTIPVQIPDILGVQAPALVMTGMKTDFIATAHLLLVREERPVAHQINTIKRIHNPVKEQHVQHKLIAPHIKIVKTGCVKDRATAIRVQIQDILTAQTLLLVNTITDTGYTHMFADVRLLLAGAVINVKAGILLHTQKDPPIQDCVKCCRPKAARRTKTVRRKRNAATDIASSAMCAPKTPIAPLTNGAAKTVIAS